MTRDELIATLEAANGPSGELDFCIWQFVNPEYTPARGWTGAASYTSSIDAALSLVLEGWDPALWMRDRWRGKAKVRLVARDGQEIHVNAMTAPIALCIAALKARS